MSKFFVLLCLTAGLMACEIKPELHPADPPPVEPFNHKVTGPGLDGNWTSACEYDLKDSKYAIYNIVLKGQDITRTKTVYMDTKCQQGPVATTYKGQFRFFKSYDKGFFELEYKLDLGNGRTLFTAENIQLRNGMLFISDFYVGNWQPNIALLPPMTAITAHDPRVGQKISFVGTLRGAAQEEDYTVQTYNVSYGDWDVLQDIRGVEKKSKVMNIKELWGTTKFTNLMKYCESQGHTREVITVAAGTFETCKMKKTDGFYWYGNVPVIGVVKIETADGTYRADLKNFIP